MFPPFVPHFWNAQFIQLFHAVQVYLFVSYFGFLSVFLKFFAGFYCFIAASHTFGWLMNGTSMESVPFETGIKAVLMKLFAHFAKHKEDKKRMAAKAKAKAEKAE